MKRQPIHHSVVVAATWLMLLLLAGAQVCSAQPQQPVNIPKIPGLTADAWNFDSASWDQAAALADFKVPGQDGADPAPAKQKSEVRLAHDGKYLYVRFTAFDTEIAKLKAASELDEFADVFPQGDHAEIWVTLNGPLVLAFDPTGNKYDALRYASDFYTGFRVKSRKGADQWETLARIPLEVLLRGQPAGAKNLSMAFVRHVDHGADTPERSTATGAPETTRPIFTLLEQ